MSVPLSENTLDQRRFAARSDIAAISLKGKVSAPRYAAPKPVQVRLASLPLRKRPDLALGYESELLFGEGFDVYDEADGWLWGQAQRDGYVGYAPAEGFAPPGLAPTHRVTALRSFAYAGQSMKAPPLMALPYGAELAISSEKNGWCETAIGFVYARHLAPVTAFEADPVAEAERFLGIPYLWGGKTSLGLDCSALVQTACRAAGILAPRDSDMQESELGEPLAPPADLARLPRGALLFWPGHVAFSQGGGMMIHANAFHMMVVSEPIIPALARIAAAGSQLGSLRLLPFSL